MTDLDGEPGGLGGCQFVIELFANVCDDTFAFFSNYGPRIDVTAPGVRRSTRPGPAAATSARRHEHGQPARRRRRRAVKAANQTLTPAQVKTILQAERREPERQPSTATGCCARPAPGRATRTASASRWSTRCGRRRWPRPAVRPACRRSAITSPANGASVTGTVTLTATATDRDGIASVQFLVDGVVARHRHDRPRTPPTGTPRSTIDGPHTITATATDTTGAYACASSTVHVGTNIQGNWVGNYGVDGYALGGWNGTTGDLVGAAQATADRSSRAAAGVVGRHRRPTSARSRRPTGTSAAPPTWYDDNQCGCGSTFTQRLQRHAPPLRGRLGDARSPRRT